MRRVGGEGGVLRVGGRNGPNNVCTYEYMNKEKKAYDNRNFQN
jgi:hypothetical protein